MSTVFSHSLAPKGKEVYVLEKDPAILKVKTTVPSAGLDFPVKWADRNMHVLPLRALCMIQLLSMRAARHPDSHEGGLESNNNPPPPSQAHLL